MVFDFDLFASLSKSPVKRDTSKIGCLSHSSLESPVKRDTSKTPSINPLEVSPVVFADKHLGVLPDFHKDTRKWLDWAFAQMKNQFPVTREGLPFLRWPDPPKHENLWYYRLGFFDLWYVPLMYQGIAFSLAEDDSLQIIGIDGLPLDKRNKLFRYLNESSLEAGISRGDNIKRQLRWALKQDNHNNISPDGRKADYENCD